MRGKLAAGVLMTSLVLAAVRAEEPKATSDTVKLSLPDKNWSLVLDLPGFSVEKNEIQPDGRRYMAATNAETGVSISSYLEKTKVPVDLEGCKASLEALAKAPKGGKMMGVSIYDLNGMKVLEFLLPEIERRRVREKNFFVCIPKEDVFVDMHIWKSGWQFGQEKLFGVILANLHFEDNPPPPPSP